MPAERVANREKDINALRSCHHYKDKRVYVTISI